MHPDPPSPAIVQNAGEAIIDVATETSPLLGGRSENSSSVPGATSVTASTFEAAQDNNGDVVEERNGSPALADKMHLILPSVGLSLFLSAFDQTVTMASYAKVGSDLDALNSVSWITTSYFLTLSSFQPLYGKLSDIFGRKACLLSAHTLFAIGCLGCGLAQSMVQLCVSRAICGMGASGLTSVTAIVISDIVPLRDRGVWQGYMNIITLSGMATGSPLGGLLADTLGWRWSFLVQVPLCGLAFLAIYYLLELPAKKQEALLDKIRRIDFLGALVLVAAIAALLAGLDSGPSRGWRHSTTISEFKRPAVA
ncbi:hypothetical protein HIM_07914 [Hirsutella minnesotensis 3608]|uniref:Major facilitator superfamily (MFS) profile domain-containing protein n=1 Tax=Hirsutella minnesotensis 3608 TaxID=1043627 RepID=A0A0F7ZYM3_9HYPO|nr:hypothetical protein HIM_07914 [Hirsutella minnesotensis 3608]